MLNKISIAIAGSTGRTTLIAQTLFSHPSFSIPWVLTPLPKKIGRKQVLTTNPLHNFATKNKIHIVLVEKKLDKSIKNQVLNLSKPNYFLVVDFGYFIPPWLLELPKFAPLNIHPSELPKWRGSSPGQFVLLFGEKKSAVSLIIMNDKLDQGSVIHQEFFETNPSWTQVEYYTHSFSLISKVLPKILLDFTQKKITPLPQPPGSITPTARKLNKQDSFIKWSTLQKLLSPQKTNLVTENKVIQVIPLNQKRKLTKKNNQNHFPPLLTNILKEIPVKHQPRIIVQAYKAFSPWPGLWTIVPTPKGEKRMKIRECSLKNNQLILEKVQLEGGNSVKWNEIKKLII